MAIPFLERAYLLETGCLQTGIALATVYSKNNRFTDAERILKNLYERFPRNSAVLKLCAKTQYELGNFSAAGSFNDLVLQREPGSLEYMLLRADLFVLEGNYIRAISLLETYAQSDQQTRDYLLLRARIQHNWNKNNIVAISFIEQALTLYPDDSVVILAAAEMASKTGQRIHGISANDFALRVLESEPKNMKAHSILVSEAASRRNWTEAYQYSSEMLAFDDITPEIVAVHIHVCLMLSRQEEARRYAEDLYRDYPTHNDVIRAYIEMLVSTRDAEAFARIEAYMSDARADMRSFLYCEQSKLRTREADKLDDLRKSLTANPQNLDTLFEFYLFYFGKKDYRKASYYLKQIVALNPSDEYSRQLNTELDLLIS
jgi:Tfp pilus assembly protein PilF